MKMNTPNKLVILRLILALFTFAILLMVPFLPQTNFVCPHNNQTKSWLIYIAAFLFIVAGITDFLDGYLARKNNQVTNFGKLFDPIADKLIVNITMIILTVYSVIPIWMTIIIVARDLLVEGLRMSMSASGTVLAADKWGKRKTIWQFIGISVVLIVWPQTQIAYGVETFGYIYWTHFALIPLYLATAFSVMSGFNYYKQNWKQIISN